MIRCSEYARTLAEPLAGTAPVARAWVALEQPGPWGRQALVESHLDRAVGARLAEAADGIPVTVLLVRQVGHHADHHVVPAPRQVWVAGVPSDGGPPWLRQSVLDDPAEALALDLAALAEGVEPEGFGSRDPQRLLLVCTNARRDRCCALLGRPVAAGLAATYPGRVWECSHLGGHRFAPSVLSLPDGFVYGGEHAVQLSVDACRGRSHLGHPAQAAELAVLAAVGDPTPRPLDVAPAGARWRVSDPERPAGPAVLVDVAEGELEPARPESCGKDPVTPPSVRARLVAS